MSIALLQKAWSNLELVYDGWINFFEIQSVGCNPLPLSSLEEPGLF